MARNPFRLSDLKTLGERLKVARKACGLTQVEVAERLNCAHPSITRWETGKAELPIGALLDLSKLYSISTDWLLTGKEDEGKSLGEQSEGIDYIVLPKHDQRSLQAAERGYLEKAITVLRSPGIRGGPDTALAHSIDAAHGSVQMHQEFCQPSRERARVVKKT